MPDLDRDTVVIAGAALLSLVALSMIAATLTSAVVTGGGGDPIGEFVGQEGSQNPMGESSNGSIDAIGGTSSGETIVLSRCVRPLNSTLGMLGYALGSGLIFYALYRLKSAAFAFLSGYALAPVIIMVYFLLTACAEAGGRAPGDGGTGDSAVGDIAGRELISAPDIPPILPVLFFGLVLVGAVALFYRSSGDEESFVDEEEEAVDGPTAEALAQAAGEAADRLQEFNADVDNEVYRAWHEMTRLLDVSDPSTSTPGDFVEAAVSAGLDRDHVEELRTLFEEVRYGHRDVDEREERAIEVFRNIEAKYGSEDGTMTGDDERAGDDE